MTSLSSAAYTGFGGLSTRLFGLVVPLVAKFGEKKNAEALARIAGAEVYDAMADAGIHPGFMASDASLLPAGDDQVSVLIEHGNALIRTPDQMANIDVPLLADAQPEFERTLIHAALARVGGKRQEAARLLGCGRNTLTRKIRELGIEA